MENIASSPNTEKVIERAEIDDLVQALHTFYEFAKMPSMKVRQRSSDGKDIPEPLFITVKSTFEASAYKNEAEELFCKSEYQQALFSYTQCLRYEQRGSEMVAEAYANRSAASFKLGKYLECQNDIRRAIRAKYPKDKRKILFERYERCGSLMANPPNPASDAVASSSSNQGGGSQEKPVEVDVRIMKEEIDGEWREMCVDLTNPLLRRTSNKIRLECNEKWGRHMVASKYIKAGEILSCERYFSTSVLLNDQCSRMLCSYCYSVSYALIPCDLCAAAMYCSIYCRRRAFNLFHRIECRMYRSHELRAFQEDLYVMIALRMLLVGTDQGAGLGTLMKKMSMRDIFAEKVDPVPNKPFSSDYSDVLKLLRTFPKPLLNFNSNPGVVVRLILTLQKTGYFGRKNVLTQKRLTNKELFTALLLTNHMLSVMSSAFLMCQQEDPAATNKRPIGIAIPILHNMLNHSCNPNVFHISRYHENAMIAIRPISEDEQIFMSYSGLYFNTPLITRKEDMAHPWLLLRFTCQCEACVEDWPTVENLADKTVTFLGMNNVKAAVLKKFDELLEPGLYAGVMGTSRTEIRHVMSRVCGWLYGNLAKPSAAIIHCEVLYISFMKYLYDTLRPYNNRQDLMMIEVSKKFSDIQVVVRKLKKR